MAEAVDSSEAWKAARVLRTLVLSWEGWEAVVAGRLETTHRVAGGWANPGSPALTLAHTARQEVLAVTSSSFGLALDSLICPLWLSGEPIK